MFLSLPDYEFHLPPGMGPPYARYWRTLGLSATTAWFVLVLRDRAGERLQVTLVHAWDTDVLNSLDNIDADVESLIGLVPAGGTDGMLNVVHIREVWVAVSDDSPDGRSIVFVDVEGQRRSGELLEPAPPVERERLVGRVRARVS